MDSDITDLQNGLIGSTLVEILEQSGINDNPEKLDAVKQLFAHYVNAFQIIKDEHPIEITRLYYQLLDKVIDEIDTSSATCTKGCSFCCHINTNITDMEAMTIADYCAKNNIPIGRTYLMEQLRTPPKAQYFSKASACVFLRDGLCSVYEVRPAECRKYFVTSDPQLCDPKEYPSPHKVSWMRLLQPEIISSAMDRFIKRLDRMADMLMPYAK